MNTKAPSTVRLALVAALLVGVLSAPLAAEPPVPGVVPAPTSLSPDAISLSDSLRTAMTDVRDGGSWNHTVLYKVMERLGEQDRLTAEQAAELEKPTYRKLLGVPDAYRLQPIQAVVIVGRVEAVKAGQMAFDRPFWLIGGWYAGHPDETIHQPVTVVSLEDPTGLLPEPSRTEGNVRYYAQKATIRQQRMELVAVLFKVAEGQLEDVSNPSATPPPQRYPVLVAWQLKPASEAVGPWPLLPYFIGAIIVVCAVAFYLLRRQIKAMRTGGSGQPEPPRYRPLRDEPVEPAAPVAPEPADEAVDPSLADAARQYQQERSENEPKSPH